MHQDNIDFHLLLLMETKRHVLFNRFPFFWNNICKARRINTARGSQHIFADSLHPFRSEKTWDVITVKLAPPGSYYRSLLLIWITHLREITVGIPLLWLWKERVDIPAWPLVDALAVYHSKCSQICVVFAEMSRTRGVWLNYCVTVQHNLSITNLSNINEKD